MVIKCWNGSCIYNKDGVCTAGDIEISVFGECLSCREADIYDDSFWGEEQ